MSEWQSVAIAGTETTPWQEPACPGRTVQGQAHAVQDRAHGAGHDAGLFVYLAIDHLFCATSSGGYDETSIQSSNILFFHYLKFVT
jgi:hypothetical protein